MRWSSVSLVGMMFAVALVTMFRPESVSSLQGDTVLAATLSGAEEVPDPGDPDGSGTATVVLRSASGEVCWDLSVANITLPAAGAHIHEGTRGVAGPVVVPFTAPDANGTATGCATTDAALMTRIMQSPESFYVNVHASDFPAGAVRGQLATAPAAQTGPAPAPATPGLPSTGADSGMRLALVGVALIVGAVGVGVGIAARRRMNID
jgi:hypothetical protein